jgi:hypothetical protein
MFQKYPKFHVLFRPRLVAATTITPLLASKPSISVKILGGFHGI